MNRNDKWIPINGDDKKCDECGLPIMPIETPYGVAIDDTHYVPLCSWCVEKAIMNAEREAV